MDWLNGCQKLEGWMLQPELHPVYVAVTFLKQLMRNLLRLRMMKKGPSLEHLLWLRTALNWSITSMTNKTLTFMIQN